jgi:tetratricopeptide (TPR) repeat protein
MLASFARSFRVIPLFMSGLLLPAGLWAGIPSPSPGGQVPVTSPGSTVSNGQGQLDALFKEGSIEVSVKGPNGAPLDGSAVVTISKMDGTVVDQKTVKNGKANFEALHPTEYNVQILAPKYEVAVRKLEVLERAVAKVTVELNPLSVEDAANSVGVFELAPKPRREVAKALEEMRANRSAEARKHLEAAQKAAPKSAEIEYLFGVYSARQKDQAQARAHWMKAIELDPKHLSSLLEVAQALLQEDNAADALPYLKRAAEAEPSSWRAHALLAEDFVLQHQNEEAVAQAERAIQLGHDQAAVVQPLLARALAGRGDREQATKVMEAYVQTHPGDVAASKDLETLKKSGDVSSESAASEMAAMNKDATALAAGAQWMPPDVDERVPPVEAGASCSLDDVVGKAGKQLLELVSDVDRFAATESLMHESVNKYGVAAYPEKRKFAYVVAIQEVRTGYLNVEEYRNGAGGVSADFPDGVATNGLPALVLIFHPYNAVNFEMTCEGLARWNGQLAWQVHFKQRADKPNTIKRYRIGADGPSYPVSLKGRAWISADNFQIVRLETDLVAPIPQIRLVADHTAIEYGPVKFAKSNVNMWLPQSAEIFYDWKGKRIHRRHSFSDYMLFGVEDKQKITVPKVADAPADAAPTQGPKQKP